MNKFALPLIFLLPFLLHAQSQDSRLGNVHTPKGDLHMLVIFVRYDNVDLMRNNKDWPDSTGENALPKFARGEINDLFHIHPEDIATQRHQNMSDFYYTMSGGTFRITGDVYPVQVPVEFIPERRNNFFARQAQMNQAAINWIAKHDPDFDWSKYDNRTNHPNYSQSNAGSAPDSILDYVVLMHRAPGSTGMGASSSLGIPGSRYRIQDGHTGIKSYTNNKHNWLYFKHEFAHNLYSCPHYLGANSADGDRYYTQKGWGMMDAWHEPFFVANAWEAWWLGWIDAQEPQANGTFILKDYLTGRDAIRIQIPGTEDYLWLENHQKIDLWDEKMFFKDESQGQPQSAKGLYAYVVGAPGADRSKPKLNPFSKKTVNFIKMMNAEGNFDWRFVGDSLNTNYFLAPVMERVADNPVSGQNDFQFLRADYNRDGSIGVGGSHGNSDSGGKEQMDLWAERIDGKDVLTIANSGDDKDAFQPGMEMGLSGKMPVTNYPIYDPAQDSLDFYVLSGISVKVLSQDESGALTLDIQLDDWNVRNTTRWCGQMLLLSVDRLADSVNLRVKRGATLSLELSGTPQRQQPHPRTGTFAPPTELRIGAGQTLTVERRGGLIIESNSRLVLEAGATLVVERGGRIEVAEGGEISLGDGVQVLVGRFGRIVVDANSDMTIGEGVSVEKEWLGTVGW
ncbi:MAG: hypothetical protein NWR72_15305 [Bacteroidia bacterium]|nr:hypothetical protein [Bacteroidia bacterium]